MKVFLLTSLLLTSTSFALDVDEKLTIRILRLSSTKKTVLVNRGEEDGLKEGDHAKIYLSSGIVARGVVVKVSPNRSVWSLYRIVMEEQLQEEVVLGLKITEPVKITEDPTKMISPDEAAKIGDDVPEDLRVENKTLRPLPKDVAIVPPPNDPQAKKVSATGETHQKRLELWGALQLNSLTSETTSATDASAEASGKISLFDFTVGGQIYFPPLGEAPVKVFNQFALGPVVHYSKQDFEVDGQSAEKTTLEFGLGGEFYFRNPFLTKSVLPFAEIRVGLGQVSTSNDEESYDGTSNFFHLGGGAKYFMTSQFSLRGSVDYYRRSETYEFDDIDNIEEKVSGFRLLFGLGIHF